MSNAILQVRRIRKTYEKGDARLEILHSLDFDVAAGKTFAIMGESGVGKSTFLQILGGLLKPSEGEVTFEGKSIFNRSDSDIASYRNESVGFIFQFHYLLPEFTALENAMLPLHIARKDSEQSKKHVLDLLDQVGLSHRVHHRPSELSGGEQQRVAIVRALANAPKLVLADEPTGNLDTETALNVSNLLMNMVKDHSMSLVIATHSEPLAKKADHLFRLKSGSLKEEVRA